MMRAVSENHVARRVASGALQFFPKGLLHRNLGGPCEQEKHSQPFAAGGYVARQYSPPMPMGCIGISSAHDRSRSLVYLGMQLEIGESTHQCRPQELKCLDLI
jgi:hypothetical protein